MYHHHTLRYYLFAGNTMALYGNIPLLLAHGKVGKAGAQKSMTAVSVCVCVC